MAQNLKNYRKFYPLHHFVFYPLAMILLAISLFEFWDNAIDNRGVSLIWLVISFVIVLVIMVSFMLRQHYALGLQDRIISNEFKFRYFALTCNRLESLSYQFSDAQLFSLRFAEDQDLIQLMDKTAENNWSPSEVKENIINWKADNRRI